MMIDTVSVHVENVNAGKLRALGVTSAKRTPSLPNVPTIAEAGCPGSMYRSGWVSRACEDAARRRGTAQQRDSQSDGGAGDEGTVAQGGYRSYDFDAGRVHRDDQG
jgi:hypothetical protein